MPARRAIDRTVRSVRRRPSPAGAIALAVLVRITVFEQSFRLARRRSHLNGPNMSALAVPYQPRLKNARERIAADKVRIASRSHEQIEVFVAGSGVEHRVRLTADDARCTCPWYSKHAASRGPCKRILAARISIEEDSGG
jgi:hypothetical protein